MKIPMLLCILVATFANAAVFAAADGGGQKGASGNKDIILQGVVHEFIGLQGVVHEFIGKKIDILALDRNDSTPIPIHEDDITPWGRVDLPVQNYSKEQIQELKNRIAEQREERLVMLNETDDGNATRVGGSTVSHENEKNGDATSVVRLVDATFSEPKETHQDDERLSTG